MTDTILHVSFPKKNKYFAVVETSCAAYRYLSIFPLFASAPKKKVNWHVVHSSAVMLSIQNETIRMTQKSRFYLLAHRHDSEMERFNCGSDEFIFSTVETNSTCTYSENPCATHGNRSAQRQHTKKCHHSIISHSLFCRGIISSKRESLCSCKFPAKFKLERPR